MVKFGWNLDIPITYLTNIFFHMSAVDLISLSWEMEVQLIPPHLVNFVASLDLEQWSPQGTLCMPDLELMEVLSLQVLKQIIKLVSMSK